MTALSYLEWRRDSDKHPLSDWRKELSGLTEDTYVTALNELKSRFKSESICAEVYLAQARYAIEKNSKRQLCSFVMRPSVYTPVIVELTSEEFARRYPVTVSECNCGLQQLSPGEESEIRASHKNLDGFTLRLYQAKKLIKEQHFAVLRPEDYRTQDTVFYIKAPEVGQYVMRIVPDIRARETVKANSMWHVSKYWPAVYREINMR